MEVDWKDMPPIVRAWYLEQEERQRQASMAAQAAEASRGEVVKRRRNPMVKPPLTRKDGTVIHYDSVVYDEPEKRLQKRYTDVRKKLGGLE